MASGTQLASRAIASLPGAQNSSLTTGEAASDQQSACSRPPEPTTRTFMSDALLHIPFERNIPAGSDDALLPYARTGPQVVIRPDLRRGSSGDPDVPRDLSVALPIGLLVGDQGIVGRGLNIALGIDGPRA